MDLYDYTVDEMRELEDIRKNDVEKVITDMFYGIQKMSKDWIKESYQYENLVIDESMLLIKIKKMLYKILSSNKELYDDVIEEMYVDETEISEEENY